MILDLGRPDMSGIEVITGLRGWLSVRIIVLSARTDSSDKVRAAAASDTDEPVVETASFTVDLMAKKVTRDGHDVHLPPTEWGMLEMLVRNRGKLVGCE